MRNFFSSILRSVEKGLSENAYIIRWQMRYPRFSGFLERRLTVRSRYGFFFSLGILLSLVGFFYFLGTAEDVVMRDPFVAADIRVANLFLDYRSIPLARALLFFTYLGNVEMIMSLGAIIVLLLWLHKRKTEIWFFVIGIITSALALDLFKNIFQRTRPGSAYALLIERTYAFPSGHATLSIVFYGLIAYGLIRLVHRRWEKGLIILSATGLIFLIGLSRVYLGVHWTSDVVAGWYLGSAILIFLITFFKEKERFTPLIKGEPRFPQKKIRSLMAVLFVLEAGFIFFFYQSHPLIPHTAPLTTLPMVVVPASTDLGTVILGSNFPKFSETLNGKTMEPVSFITVGSKEKIIEAFQKAGWYLADKPNAQNLFYLAYAALSNKPYPTAPVTPTFLDAQPEDMAFQKATAMNSVKERHHTRFWRTNFFSDGQPLWIATASFDSGLRYFVTHRISPDIDTERDYIRDDLLSTGMVSEIQEIQLVRPLLGRNQGGDQFFTNGRAYLIVFK